MNTSNSDLSIDSGASSSLDAVEDSLDRQTGYRGPRQWQAPAPRRPTRVQSEAMSSPPTGQEGGTLADPFESGSPPELVHRSQFASRYTTGAPAFQTPDMASANQQLAQPPALYRFQPPARSHVPAANGSPVQPNAASSSSTTRHESSTPQASLHTTLAGAVTPANTHLQPPHSHERQLNPMSPPPPAPTRPTRQASDVAQHAQPVAPSLWRAGPVRSRTSDAFASPASSSFSADLAMHMPSFQLPTTSQAVPQSTANLDAAALAAERRNIRAAAGNTFATPTGQAQPMLSQLERQQYEQHQQMLHEAAQQRYEQQLRAQAELGMGAPARRMISFATPEVATYTVPPHGVPIAPVRPSHSGQDISLSVSSYGSLPALPGARGAAQDQSVASYATSNYEDSTSASADAAIPPAPANTAQFQKWDGSAMTVPLWVVSANGAEEEVEEWFESDAVERFDVAAIAARTKTVVQAAGEVMDEDVLKGILETQLGLRTGLGWYGYTYRNPKPAKVKDATPKPEDGAPPLAEAMDTDTGDDRAQGSRKRRRISSSLSPVAGAGSAASADDASESGSEAVDLVYDAFGRVRGTVPKMGYLARGGPRVPLPPPLETAALRTAAARDATLRAYVRRSKHEARLLADLRTVRDQYDTLHNRNPTTRENDPDASTVKSHAFYTQVKAKRHNLAQFRAKHRPALLKGLQNALLAAPAVHPLSAAYADES